MKCEDDYRRLGFKREDHISLLFFSRGRGRGHAIPDAAIVEELPRFLPNFKLLFASYATGAEFLCNTKFALIDLQLPEENSFVETLHRAAHVIEDLRPAVVIAHEEFAALPAARVFAVPTVFITDWFPHQRSIQAECLSCADSIVFIGNPGVFPVPDSVKDRALYVGPVVRKILYDSGDRLRARQELEVPSDALVLSVIPGAWATEGKTPLLDLVLAAVDAVETTREKCVFWAAAKDHAEVLAHCADRHYVRVLRDYPVIERLMVATDVAITKGNRGSIMDLASLGIPSISLSFGSNPVDDVLVARIASNLALNAHAVDSVFLARCIEQIVSLPVTRRPVPLDLHLQGGGPAAEVLAREVQRLMRARSEGLGNRPSGTKEEA